MNTSTEEFLPPGFDREETCLVDLFQRIAERDESAMADLFGRTKSRLAAYVARILRNPWDTEEVVQDVYRQLWRSASTYRPVRGCPSAWLYMAARSRAIDYLRNRQEPAPVPLSGRESGGGMCEPVLDGRIAGCLRDQLERILLRLPAAQRQTLILAFFEGYTHSEIAARTGVPLGTVKTRIRKGLAKLRKLLADDDGRNVPPPAVRAPKVLRFAA